VALASACTVCSYSSSSRCSIAGLMVGRHRTLCKKIEPREMTSPRSTSCPDLPYPWTPSNRGPHTAGTSAVFNPGPMGSQRSCTRFTEAAQNNGSAFGGYRQQRLLQSRDGLCQCLSDGYAVILITLALAGRSWLRRSCRSARDTPRSRPRLLVWVVCVVVSSGRSVLFRRSLWSYR